MAGREVEDPVEGLRQRHAGIAHRERRVGTPPGPAVDRRGGAEHPVADVLDAHAGPQRGDVAVHLERAHPLPQRRPGRDRSARDHQPERDRHRRAGVRLHHALAPRPAQAHPQHVGHRRAAGGPGLAAQQPPDHDPVTNDMRAQTVGSPGGVHAGILGCH